MSAVAQVTFNGRSSSLKTKRFTGNKKHTSFYYI